MNRSPPGGRLALVIREGHNGPAKPTQVPRRTRAATRVCRFRAQNLGLATSWLDLPGLRVIGYPFWFEIPPGRHRRRSSGSRRPFGAVMDLRDASVNRPLYPFSDG